MCPESKLRIESLFSREDSRGKKETACPATVVGVITTQPNSAEKQQSATDARKNQNSSGLFTNSLKCKEDFLANPGTPAGSVQLPTAGKVGGAGAVDLSAAQRGL